MTGCAGVRPDRDPVRSGAARAGTAGTGPAGSTEETP
jgi:hypothetical protein